LVEISHIRATYWWGQLHSVPNPIIVANQQHIISYVASCYSMWSTRGPTDQVGSKILAIYLCLLENLYAFIVAHTSRTCRVYKTLHF